MPRHATAARPSAFGRGPIALALSLSWSLIAGASLSVLASRPACAAPAETPIPEAALPSRLDAPLFYQLLIGELELGQGQPGTAYAVLLDAARRTRDENLFQRAMEIALRGQAGNEALAAAQAWRAAHPRSLEAVRSQARILLALNRLPALVEPLKQLIELTPAADRESTITNLPRLFKDHPDPRLALQVLQNVLIPLADGGESRSSGPSATQLAAQLALARALMQAGQGPAALALAADVARRQPESAGPALLALELLGTEPQAQSMVADYLARPGAQGWVRLAYAQWLGSRSQKAALAEYRQVVREMPDMAQAWYGLGALAADAGERQEAEAALKRFLELHGAGGRKSSDGAAGRQAPSGPASGDGASAPAPNAEAGHSGSGTPEGAADAPPRQGARDGPQEGTRDGARDGAPDGLTYSARLMLSQLAIDRGDFPAAQRWLEGLEGEEWRRDVQVRRALLMAKQGRLEQARQLIRALPETSPKDGPSKALTESQVLRSVDRWRDARTVLSRALERAPDHVELHYELALVLEKLGRFDEMERHLRRIIEIQPDHHHAHNALGFSLAERNIRLEEAQGLIDRALELAPGDPFITDSAAWVAYRQKRLERAEELLRQAFDARSDTEIGTHLGEVLWARGQKDQARRIWRELRRRDSGNKLLRDTLARLKVDL